MAENQPSDLEKAFLVEFECPICSRYIFPPIYQCSSGHCFCSTCFANLRRCGLCRAPKSEARCYVLEKMHALLTFPCKYESEGCDFKGTGDVVVGHQNFCKHSSILCPLRFNNCQWRGRKQELVAHCMAEHPQNIFFNTKQKLISSRFTDLKDRYYYIIFNVFNNIFRCSWDLDKESGMLRFAVYCLGKAVTRELFFFEVTILCANTNCEVISMKGPCFRMEDDSDRFMRDKYLVLKFNMIKEFCDENGDLNYSIRIFSKDS